MPVSGYLSITLKYEDVKRIDGLRKSGEKRSEIIRRAIKLLEKNE